MKKPRKMFGKWDDACVQEIVKLMETQSKNTLMKWCLSYTLQHILPIYKKYYPTDNRPEIAIESAYEWIEGKNKLPEVKKKILDTHAAAREAEGNYAAQAAARTCGQASASIHVPTHAIGLVFYGTAAIAYDKIGINQIESEYQKIFIEECKKMLEALQNIAVKNEENLAKLNWNC